MCPSKANDNQIQLEANELEQCEMQASCVVLEGQWPMAEAVNTPVND